MTTTIQQTGKGLKAALVASQVVMVVGPVLIVAGQPLGVAVFVGGLIGLLVTRALIWWNHA